MCCYSGRCGVVSGSGSDLFCFGYEGWSEDLPTGKNYASERSRLGIVAGFNPPECKGEPPPGARAFVITLVPAPSKFKPEPREQTPCSIYNQRGAHLFASPQYINRIQPIGRSATCHSPIHANSSASQANHPLHTTTQTERSHHTYNNVSPSNTTEQKHISSMP